MEDNNSNRNSFKQTTMKGGKRTGAGRKPCTDKKQQMTIYVLTSRIEKLGKDAIRQVCEKAINEAALK
jgi:hypothetical protein